MAQEGASDQTAWNEAFKQHWENTFDELSKNSTRALKKDTGHGEADYIADDKIKAISKILIKCNEKILADCCKWYPIKVYLE